MKIEKIKECAVLWEKYNSLHKELADVIQQIEDLDEDTPACDVDYDDRLEMGSPLHRKLEAMLNEFHIDRDAFKEYCGKTTMKHVKVGQAMRFINDPDVWTDAINGRNG